MITVIYLTKKKNKKNSWRVFLREARLDRKIDFIKISVLSNLYDVIYAKIIYLFNSFFLLLTYLLKVIKRKQRKG